MTAKTRLARGITDEIAIARGFPWAVRAPIGHSVSWHRSEGLAMACLARYFRKMNCTVVNLGRPAQGKAAA